MGGFSTLPRITASGLEETDSWSMTPSVSPHIYSSSTQAICIWLYIFLFSGFGRFQVQEGGGLCAASDGGGLLQLQHQEPYQEMGRRGHSIPVRPIGSFLLYQWQRWKLPAGTKADRCRLGRPPSPFSSFSDVSSPAWRSVRNLHTTSHFFGRRVQY